MYTQKRLIADLEDLQTELEDAQTLIDHARSLHQHNVLFNRQLDIRQINLDRQKSRVEASLKVLRERTQ